MINIDWSYAPSGATHFHKGDIMYRPHWRKSGFYCDLGLEAFGWIKDTYPSPISECIERPKKQEAWGGVGLPPIGMASCEYLGAHKYYEWTVVNIFAHYGHTVFVDFGDGWRAEKDSSRFRPIKTAEQLAEEEKVAAIAEMQAVVMAESGCTVSTISECLAIVALYEAGYRKQ